MTRPAESERTCSTSTSFAADILAARSLQRGLDATYRCPPPSHVSIRSEASSPSASPVGAALATRVAVTAAMTFVAVGIAPAQVLASVQGCDARTFLSAAIELIQRDTESETATAPLPDDSVEDLLSRLERGLPLPYAGRLAGRLRHLAGITRDEAPHQAPLDPVSLRGLIAFLAKETRAGYPDTVLTPDGHIRARWRQDDRHYLAVEFLDLIDVRFVVVAPDRRHPYKTTRHTGTATIDSLNDVTRVHGVEDWMFDTDTG